MRTTLTARPSGAGSYTIAPTRVWTAIGTFTTPETTVTERDGWWYPTFAGERPDSFDSREHSSISAAGALKRHIAYWFLDQGRNPAISVVLAEEAK